MKASNKIISSSYNSPEKYYIFRDLHFNKPANDPINIVMIDDTKKDIDLVEELLFVESSLNFTLAKYTNSGKALEDIENNHIHPDLIILDLMMPCLNGAMVLEKLKSIANSNNVPIVIHSSMNNHLNVLKMNSLQAHAFFEKPLDIGSFEDFVSGSLNFSN